jgi:hypothetical protein
VGVGEILEEALRIARTHKSLWLFGFLVALGFPFPRGGGEPSAPPAVPGISPDPARVVPVIIAAVAVIAAYVVLKFLATGALIEGVRRARRNGSMTVREGFREGWAHWGVLFRVALLYLPMYLGSVLVLVGAPGLLIRAGATPGGIVAAGVAVLVGVPWLLTLFMWQAFAECVAVLENRRALDAMRKARLFLHGRLKLGLKLFVAAFVGALFVTAVGLLVIAPIVFVFASASVWAASAWGTFVAVGLGVLTVAPLVFVAVAFFGIMTSSVWPIGYLSEVEQ